MPDQVEVKIWSSSQWLVVRKRSQQQLVPSQADDCSQLLPYRALGTEMA